MKTWAEVDSSPEFHLAPDDVKQEIRAFYRDGIASSPGFASLSPQDKAAVLRAVEGDEDYPIRMAAALIVAAQRGTLARAMVDADVNAEPGLKMVLKGAKYAERFLDVPVEERPRDAFSDSIPKHLDRPLRALLGFVDDALPEYSQDKFWRTHAKSALLNKIRNVLALSNEFPTIPIDAHAILLSSTPIKSYSELDSRIPTKLPPLKTWPVPDADAMLQKDPEAALKFGLPQAQWARVDAAVNSVVINAILAPVKNGVPRGIRPDAVNRVAQDVRKKAYAYLARALYQVASPSGNLPLDAERLAPVILAADILAPGMSAIAADFPYLFSVVAGESAIPPAAKNRFFAFLEALGVPLTPQFLLNAVTTGQTSLIRLASMDETLFQEGANLAGAPAQAMPLLQQDAVTVRNQTLIASLVAWSEILDRQAYKDAQKKVRAKVQEEVRRQFAAPAPAPAPAPVEKKDAAPAAPEAPENGAAEDGTAEEETTPEDEPAVSLGSGKDLGYGEPTDDTAEDSTGEAEGSTGETAASAEAAAGAEEAGAESPASEEPKTTVVVVPAPEVTVVLPASEPLASAPLAKFGDVLAVDPASIGEHTPHGKDPRSLKRREKRLLGVRQRFEGKGLPLAVVVQHPDGKLTYIDGSYRGTLAQERKALINVVVIPEEDCHKMMEQDGMDQKEVALMALRAAGAAGVESAAHLQAQYPNLRPHEEAA